MSGQARDRHAVRRKILVVDDAPVLREIESLFLSRVGRVLSAGSGIDALTVARRERPDVVVADLTMPGMDGSELCRRIKADPELRRTPVIIVAGNASGDDHERAVKAGADDVVARPVSRLALIEAVNRFLKLAVRGLVRVSLETDVRLDVGSCETWGRSRNLSRGGIFIESQATLEPTTELALEFAVPGARTAVAPTATVVWRRTDGVASPPGMGMRFLQLDSTASRTIDEYVYERAATDGAGLPGPVVPVR